MGSFFDLTTTGDLLGRDFVQQALVALALLGLLGGLLSPLIVARQMSFAVHGVSELSVTGAAAALLAGFSVNLGRVIGLSSRRLPSEFSATGRASATR